MSLDYSQHYHLREPKMTDDVDQIDFNRFFTTNINVIDAELYRLSEALSALGSGGSAASPEEITALQTSFQSLRTYVNGFADRISELERNAPGEESADLSALNSTIASVQQTLGNYGTRISVLEQGGIPTATLDSLNDALSGIRQTLTGYGTRISTLEDADHEVNLAPLEGRVGALENILPDVLPVANGLTGRVAALERAQAAHNGFAGQFDALETLVGTLSARLNALSSTVDELENISGIADTTALSNRISALSREISSDMTLLANRVALLENSAFADLGVNEADEKWYAYNMKGVAVDGPFGSGYGNDSRTLAEFFNLEADSGNNSEGVVLEPERPNTLAEIFGFDIE